MADARQPLRIGEVIGEAVSGVIYVVVNGVRGNRLFLELHANISANLTDVNLLSLKVI